MPREPRIHYPSGIYHIYNRGIGKKLIFKEPQDFVKIMSILTKLSKENLWIIYAYCFMPNHYHILVEEKLTSISKLISRLFGSYSQFFNKKYKQDGSLFPDRFKSKIIQKDSYLLEVSRYIHCNPVKAGLVSKPDQYHYSSFVEYLNKSNWEIINIQNVTRLINDNNKSLSEYISFVKEGINVNLDKYNPFINKNDIVGSNIFNTHRKYRHFSA